MNRLFTRHLDTVDETYFQHLTHAATFSGWMALGTVFCLVHAVFPFLFERSGSRIIEKLHDRMVVNRAKLSHRQDTTTREGTVAQVR